MPNCKAEVKGDTLVLTVNLKERHGLSASKQTVKIGGTEGGNQALGRDGIMYSVNVYTKEGLDAERAKEGLSSIAEEKKAEREAKRAAR